MGCNCSVDSKKCEGNCIKVLGTIVGPCLSLFNHSCYPNVLRIFCKGGRVMLFSMRPIKKNEQVIKIDKITTVF